MRLPGIADDEARLLAAGHGRRMSDILSDETVRHLQSRANDEMVARLRMQDASEMSAYGAGVDAVDRLRRVIIDGFGSPTSWPDKLAKQERQVREAFLIHQTLKLHTAQVAEEVAHALTAIRREALDQLQAEVAAGRLGGNRVTNDLIDFTARERYPKKWAELRARQRDAEAARDSVGDLRDRLEARGRVLIAIIGEDY